MKLSDNFTNCVMEYSRCLDTSEDQDYCKREFDDCSLAILSDARLDDELVQSFVYDPTKNLEGEEAEHALSNDLFVCIQAYMMCTMKKQQFCMRDYNQCTLRVLDAFNADIDSNLIGREGSEDEGILQDNAGGKEQTGEDESKEEGSSSDGSNVVNNAENIKECDGFKVPKTFGSFSGKPAQNDGKNWI